MAIIFVLWVFLVPPVILCTDSLAEEWQSAAEWGSLCHHVAFDSCASSGTGLASPFLSLSPLLATNSLKFYCSKPVHFHCEGTRSLWLLHWTWQCQTTVGIQSAFHLFTSIHMCLRDRGGGDVEAVLCKPLVFAWPPQPLPHSQVWMVISAHSFSLCGWAPASSLLAHLFYIAVIFSV